MDRKGEAAQPQLQKTQAWAAFLVPGSCGESGREYSMDSRDVLLDSKLPARDGSNQADPANVQESTSHGVDREGNRSMSGAGDSRNESGDADAFPVLDDDVMQMLNGAMTGPTVQATALTRSCTLLCKCEVCPTFKWQ